MLSNPHQFDDLQPEARTLPAWLFSVLLHAILLVVAGLLLTQPSKGTQAEPDRPIGLAVVRQLNDRVEYQPVETVQPTEVENPTEQSEQATVATAAAASPAIDLDSLLDEAASTPIPTAGAPVSDATASASAAVGSDGPDLSGTRPKVYTELFGVEGYGNRFVYVFDRSDSMNGFGGRPLLAAKMQLIRSLESLGESQQFQIIFYNTQASPFVSGSGTVQLLSGDEITRRMASQYVRSVQAFGGTEHLDALKMGLRMSPDVIFFLTDARLPRMSKNELKELRSRALRSGTTIHTIEFGSEPAPPADTFLRALAEQNNGEYRYVDVRRLSGDGQIAPVEDADVQ